MGIFEETQNQLYFTFDKHEIVCIDQGKDQRVICYASRCLTDGERRNSQTEKEALALVWACDSFNMYLYRKEFELLTDH